MIELERASFCSLGRHGKSEISSGLSERERNKRWRCFREIRCNGAIGSWARLRMVSNNYISVPVRIIIVVVYANRECNPVG
jgi:hypothetical protein